MTVSQMMKNTSRASYPDFPQQLSDNVQSRDPRRRGERGPRQAFTWETDTQLTVITKTDEQDDRFTLDKAIS